MGSTSKRDTSQLAILVKLTAREMNIPVCYIKDVEDLNIFDEIYVEHNVYQLARESLKDGKASINFFGGPNKENTKIFRLLSEFRGKVYSIYDPFPDYIYNLRKRSVRFNVNNLQEIQNNSEYIEFPGYKDSLIIGDSHSCAYWEPGYSFYPLPGKTMNGFIGMKLNLPENLRRAKFVFGNIDIRHHIVRLDLRKDEIERWIETYVNKIKSYNIEQVELAALYPVEGESRKIPGSSCYKGKPYYGTWEERSQAVGNINNLLRAACVDNRWTFNDFYDQYKIPNSYELDQKVMEPRQGVHINPKFYESKWYELPEVVNYDSKEPETGMDIFF